MGGEASLWDGLFVQNVRLGQTSRLSLTIGISTSVWTRLSKGTLWDEGEECPYKWNVGLWQSCSLSLIVGVSTSVWTRLFEGTSWVEGED